MSAVEYLEQTGRQLDEPAPRRPDTSGPSGATPTELTDVGNADRLVRQYGDRVRYVDEWGFMNYRGSHWERDEIGVRKRMIETARRIHIEAASEPNQGRQSELSKWAVQSQQAQRLRSALWCAAPAVGAQVDDFDQHPWLLSVANGTLDLSTGELREHRAGDLITKTIPVAYDPAAPCPQWNKFLTRVLPDDEVRAFFQRFAGYAATGSTAEQVMAFLYGSGRNGKSVAMETLAALFGDYHKATRTETLSVTHGGGVPNDVAALAGARLVTVSETAEGQRLNESLIKDLTGSDTITARFMRREFFSFVMQGKIMMRGNHRPQIRGTDDGIWRRMLLIPFTEQIPEHEIDPDLPQKLLAELPGILTWVVAGCLDWQATGLRPPEAVRQAVREYRSESDVLGAFIDECCIVGPGVSAKAKALYDRYREWCEEGGERANNHTRFGRALVERGFEKHKNNTIRYHGIGLAANEYESTKWGES